MRAFVKLREMLETNRELAENFRSSSGVSTSTMRRSRDSGSDQAVIAPAKKARREIGFHVREKAPRYRVRKRA